VLGSLPKLFDKNFVIGFYLPTLLAIIACAWAFPSLPFSETVRSLAASEKILGDLTYLAVAVWVLAIFLMTFNEVQYRLLEGYLPPVSWLFLLRRWHRWRFRRLKRKYDKLMTKWQVAVDNGQDLSWREQRRAAYLLRRRKTHYPSTESEILPTRFGNIIRSFEVYPRELYCADSIAVWPRLASVIPKEFGGFLDDARAQVSFFVNITDLALLIALTSFAGAAYDSNWLQLTKPNIRTLDGLLSFLGPAGLRHAAWAAIALMIAGLAYSQATARALTWGELVKSAFDCYLPALIKQLGFVLPPSHSEHREFWKEFNRRILFQLPMTANRWPLASEVVSKQEPPKPLPDTEPKEPAEEQQGQENRTMVIDVPVAVETRSAPSRDPPPSCAPASR